MLSVCCGDSVMTSAILNGAATNDTHLPGTRQMTIATSAAAIAPATLLCPACGYDLRAIQSDRCPECGLAIDRALGVASQIPWTHRKRIGTWRAYARTAFLVMLRPSRIAAEIEIGRAHV